MSNVLHTLFRPGVGVTCSITQLVQDRHNGSIVTDQSEFTNQLRYFFGVDVVVIAGLVLARRQLRMRPASPMQLEVNGRRIVGGIGDNFLEDSSGSASSRDIGELE